MNDGGLLLMGAALSALLNLVIFAALPLLLYFAYHKLRHKRTLAEVAARAGLQRGASRYLVYSAAGAVVFVAALLLWSPPVEAFIREGSPQRVFRGLGFSAPAVTMAALYGIVKTGFPEEVLFRGLIAGSLARRLSVTSANITQALIFLAPHLLVLRIMPELWGVLPLVFLGALYTGWIRIKSGSVLGPWLIHGALNTTLCLSIAVRTAT